MIYTVENTINAGRPAAAYLNGVRIDKAFYADTERGIVRAYKSAASTPREKYLMQIKGTTPVITYSGKVRVEPIL